MKRGFKPELLRRVKVKSKEGAEKRSVISRRNTSKFFTQLYQCIYGGKVNNGKSEDTKIILERGFRRFCPDILTSSEDELTFTEIKSFSVRRSSPVCSLNQLENYCYSLLNEFEKETIPRVTYAFFKYGDSWKTDKLHALTNPSLVRLLCQQKKDLMILPLNLIFLLLAFSRFEKMDQTTSDSPLTSQTYFRPRGRALTGLQKDNDAIKHLAEEYREIPVHKKHFLGDLNDLHLDTLECERTISQRVKINYSGGDYVVEPFPTTRYFQSRENYQKWLAHFSKNHGRMMESLGLRDIFEERRIIYNPRPEEDGIPY